MPTAPSKPLDLRACPCPLVSSLFLPVYWVKLDKRGKSDGKTTARSQPGKPGRTPQAPGTAPSPTYRAIGRGLHLGYRKGKTGGVWVVRRYIGGQSYNEADRRPGRRPRGRQRRRNLRLLAGARDARAPCALAPSVARTPSRMQCATTSRISRGAHLNMTRRSALRRTPFPPSVTPLSRIYQRGRPARMAPWHCQARGAHSDKGRSTEQGYRPSRRPRGARGRQASANRCLGLLKAALNHAWRDGKCELGAWPRVKPFRGVDIPALPLSHASLSASV